MENSDSLEYYELPGFEEIYLEDSYLVGLTIRLEEVNIHMEFVLRENHPRYKPPLVGEKYCYHEGAIRFTEHKRIELWDIINAPSIDADGEVDFGNIDVFRRLDARFYLSGDWGELYIFGGQVEAVLSE